MSTKIPSRSKRPPKKSASDERPTRELILDAAWQLFEARERADVRLEDIARSAGVSRQAVYLHFNGRAALLDALISHIQERLDQRRWVDAIDQAATGEAALAALVRFAARYTPKMYPFARALWVARDADDIARAAWDERMKRRRTRSLGVARRLREDGVLTDALTVDEAADLVSLLTSLSTWEQLVEEGKWSAARYERHTLRVLRAALLTPRT